MKRSLTVIVPAYNEEASLEKIVRDTLRVVEQDTDEFEIVIVDDGSTDETREVAQRICEEHDTVRLAGHDHNQGSGMAIRTGIAQARCDMIIYVPADDQFNILEIGAFLDAAETADIVIGVRLERSDYSWFRLLSSKTFIRLTNFLFNFQYRDVNWVHLWKRHVFDRVRPRSEGVFLLEEVLVRADAAGLTVNEVDSEYQPRIAGKPKGCRISAILITIYEMLCLWWELRWSKGKPEHVPDEAER